MQSVGRAEIKLMTHTWLSQQSAARLPGVGSGGAKPAHRGPGHLVSAAFSPLPPHCSFVPMFVNYNEVWQIRH